MYIPLGSAHSGTWGMRESSLRKTLLSELSERKGEHSSHPLGKAVNEKE